MDRYNEIAAVAAATQVAEILTALAMEPSGKRFAKSRNEARERWAQLSQLAASRANAAFGATKAEKKPRVAKPTPASAVFAPADAVKGTVAP